MGQDERAREDYSGAALRLILCCVLFIIFLRCDAMRRAVSRYRPVAVLAGVDEGSE